jgi:crotonobetainyl-CoA:carnitine CoA-transferase CaiB-like acyl-CoA transferase
MAPHGLFRCAGEDRWVAIAVRDAADRQAQTTAMERPDLAQRPELRGLAGRQAAAGELETALEHWTREQNASEIETRLQEAGVPAGRLLDIEDLLADPAMGTFFMEFDHPAGVKFLAQNQPFLWNGERLPIRRAPFFGEHNDAVFRDELGLGDDEITRLIVDGVIR